MQYETSQQETSKYEAIKKQIIEKLEKDTSKTFFERSCRIKSIENNIATIEVGTKFLYDVANRQHYDINKAFKALLGDETNVIFILDKVKSFYKAPIEIMPVCFNTIDLLYAYHKGIDVSLIVDDKDNIKYDNLMLTVDNTGVYSNYLKFIENNKDESIVIIASDMIPFVFNGIGVNNSVLDEIGEICYVKLPYIENKECYKHYLELTGKECLSIPYNNHFAHEEVTWNDIARHFDYWGDYLNYCSKFREGY